METFKQGINSFKGYDKVNIEKSSSFKRKTTKRIIIISVSVLLLIVIVIAAAIGVGVSRRNGSTSPSAPATTAISTAQSIKAVCSVTRYPDSCASSLSAEMNQTKIDPEELYRLSLKIARDEMLRISDFPKTLSASVNDSAVIAALADCNDQIGSSIDRLNDSLSATEHDSNGKILTDVKIDDLKTWLSASLTYMDTCLEGLPNSTYAHSQMEAILKNATQFTSNSLAITTKIVNILQHLNIPIHRRLLSNPSSGGEFPSWVSSKDRKLLQTATKPDITVASDGSGDVMTVTEAIAKVPEKSLTRFVIYVKSGTYVENVKVDKKKVNVMMYGDGMDKTTISGSLNFIDGTPTMSTATVTIIGNNFIAMNMGFKNTAGAEKHQAVALRVASDHSVFYKCKFDAYQDTLYTHALRQFYKDCTIAGTIDFIFGNAAVVFQGCTIIAKQPLANQINTITAQGKSDPNQNTGISIHSSSIVADAGALSANTYLGRPWRPYSTTIVMKTNIGSLLHPAGWVAWSGTTTAPDTIFYGEYLNIGAGADTTKRVTWKGYNPTLSSSVASKFAVDTFIQGNDWIPNSGVEYLSTV